MRETICYPVLVFINYSMGLTLKPVELEELAAFFNHRPMRQMT